MPASDIVIKGAREHNLRDVDLVLPRNKLICLTGVSGSGKSSLAFDTLYAEGQRRYVESLSTFARQFLGQMPKPDVDFLGGLSPTISISQKTSGRNPRSTVGTITEIYDYLRVLYARVGQGHCPKCRRPITAQTREAILARILSLPEKTRFSVLAPIVRQQKGEFRDLFQELLRQGFVRARVDGTIISLTDNLSLDRQMRHNIEVVIDRLVVSKDVRTRLAEAVETALKVGQGNLVVAQESPDAPADERRVGTAHQRNPGTAHQRNPGTANEHERPIPQAPQSARSDRSGLLAGDMALSADYACTHCGLSFQPPSPQLFSFNSPQGMCLECDGLGQFYSFDPHLLVTEPGRTFKEGCIEVVGTWQELGRWKRHIYEGVAETIERLHELPPGTILDTPWQDLADAYREMLLWGTGDEHITYTWRVGRSTQKYGGKYEGIIPELLQKYRTSKSRPQINKLEKYMSVIRCPDCQGQRLNPQARSVTLTTTASAFADRKSISLPELCDLPVRRAVEFFQDITLDPTQQKIAVEVLKEIRGRLGFLMDVGLDYLTLSRTAPTLSGGESQRIRLAGQIGCGLVGVLYILDEPSIGLHARDNDRLLATLARLRDQGNTVIVVEHDEDTMRAADYLVDFGPGAGIRGGHIVAAGSDAQLTKSRKSVTGAYLAGKRKIHIPKTRRTPGKERLTIVGASHNNLKDVDVEIPLGVFVCVTGVSGSGKSSVVNDILVEALRRDLNGGKGEPGAHRRINGLKHLDKLIAIDQSPIGRTPRSNPATYIKVFDDIRGLYAQLPESKRRGYKPGRFSFNVKGGRCEACEGNGSNKLEMDFLADVWVTCPVCEGHRFNRETLQVQFRGKSISDVLEMDIQEALAHFENIPAIAHKLQTLHDVGMDYIKLGQPSPTLSGGEAQRIKLARELVKKSTGRTLYLLDEPTTGLHFADIEMLLKVLHDFVEAGNTVLVVEHNLDVIKTADWIIDIGPEGGEHGGRIVAAGTPEQLVASADSHTGVALAPVLAAAKATAGGNGAPKAQKLRRRSVKEAKHIRIEGARQHNLRDIDVKIPREQMTVCCGPSGSGKSSLAMDTIYAEGQRRYVESLSSYARQFVGQMQKPAIEHIEGLSPSIAIEQRHLGHTPRSTVGTVTEIYDYFRILFARLGQPYCPDCDIPVGTQSADEVIDRILAEPEGTRLYLMAPLEIGVGEEYEALWEEIRASGYVRVRIDGQTYSIDDLPQIDRRRRHEVEVVVDRIVVRKNLRARIADTVENALALGRGVVHAAYPQEDVEERKWRVLRHSQHRACERCGRSFEELTPHHFSFNSAIGWCPSCEGLGTQTGANPAALLRDTELSLAEGAVLLWPNMSAPLAAAMLQALSRATGIPTDVPYQDLSSKQRRQVLFGTGAEWFTVEGGAFRFQYKGLYPALEEAARLSPGLRSRLDHLVDEIECSECGGSRLRDDASAVRLRRQTIEQISRAPLGDLLEQVKRWRLSARERKIAGELVREIKNRLTFLIDVGLEYLTIGRSAPTLSGGESQRIRLASQVGSGLCGVLYVLDEPTIGLHPRDNRRLIAALHKLRDLGNTLLVVEHDREVVGSADRLLDFGPAAGRLGGRIVAEGSPGVVSKRRTSVTGPYLSGKKAIPVPTNRRISDSRFQISDFKQEEASSTTDNGQQTTGQSAICNLKPEIPSLRVLGARHHNLKNIDVTIPLRALTVVAGVSGSGKSSLVNDILHAQLARILHRARTNPGAHDEVAGIEHVNKVIRVDQQALGNTPTSNPATYSGVFELIRQLFAQLPDAKVRGFQPRRFSFNVPGGRCDDCEGAGQKCIEMHFLPDVWVECETCLGRRYNPETLAVTYRGKSIADVLEMSCSEALALFENIPKIRRILQTLCDVGLGYVTLGQAAPTLSGGEAQRVKLAAELARPDTGRTLYLLDEPTTGLHFDDLAKLLDVLHRLVDLGNTVVVIEHNLDVMKQADWIIELGPEAGAAGGYLVTAGPPESVVEHAAKSRATNGQSPTNPKSEIAELRSPTAQELAPILAAGPHKKRQVYDPRKAEAAREGDIDITDVGRDAHMPWETDGRRWHVKDRVGRDGTPCKWDGRILDEVERRIQEKGRFSPTNWNARSVVEICAEKKSDGWFFHAITGETWLLKMKFRVARRTFRREELLQKIRLTPLDDLHDVPLYGDRSRVRCKNIRGPWQEVQIDAHSWNEMDTPEFWDFVDQAIEGFQSFTERLEQNPEDVMPWKKLGQKWHLSRKGFPPGKQPAWDNEVLEELVNLLMETAPDGQFLWNNQQVVHLFLPQQRDPWASIYTKRLDALDLTLCGPKDEFALGRIAGLGADRDVATDRPDRDTVKLRFVRPDEVTSDEVRAFIEEHCNSVRSAAAVP